MSKINWKSPEERRAYHRKKSAEYRKKFRQVALTFSPAEYSTLEDSGKRYKTVSLNNHIKSLAVEAAKLGLGEMIECPPSVPQDIMDQMIQILRTYGNNINQIAHHLNIKAKEERRQIVAGYDDSVRIQDACFQILRNLEAELLDLTSSIHSPRNSISQNPTTP